MTRKTGKPATVAIVEDNPNLRGSLETIIGRAPTLRCIGGFATAEDALNAIPGLAPDVILMDINLPGMSGVECVRRLARLNVGSLIVMLTVNDDDDAIFEALSAGAIGYLLKPVTSDTLVQAIHEVCAGGAPMSMPVARRVVQTFKKPAPNAAGLDDLTPREREILELLARGFLSKEIADQMTIAYWTVVDHVRHIYEKLHVRTRTEAVAKYLSST
jgi:DNA-binding NarL/FixJ family response regulator